MASAQDFDSVQWVGWYTYNPLTVDAADLDGDGRIDVLSGSSNYSTVVWFRNMGTGKGYHRGYFSSAITLASGMDRPNRVYAEDLDGDGDPDVLVSSEWPGTISWFENKGGGTFSGRRIVSSAPDRPQCLHAADLNGDGAVDVVSISLGDTTIAWYENLGPGSSGYVEFGPPQVITTAANWASWVHTADLDGDGDPDVLAAATSSSTIVWYENLGRGVFGPKNIITTNAQAATSVHCSDIDMDGDQDVLSSSYADDKIAWYENRDGLGSFGPQRVISGNAKGAYSVRTADLDSNGTPDVVYAAGRSNRVIWQPNLGGGTFGPRVFIDSDVDAYAVVTADIDGDSIPEVISALKDDGRIAWYANLIRDCNGNGIKDEDDIASGASEDCDGNRVPDECDILPDQGGDWDGDGIVDDCVEGWYCDATMNSDGRVALASLEGSAVIADDDFTMVARNLPDHEWGFFMMSPNRGFLPHYGGGAGNLCLGAPVYLFDTPPTGKLLYSGGNRQFRFKAELTNLPNGVQVQIGETWYIQAWYRDMFSSNTSIPVVVMWR